MKSIKFKEANIVLAEDQEQYETIHAYAAGTKEGHIVTCWKLSAWERFKLLITGKLWMTMLTFGEPMNPIYMTVTKKEVLTNKEEKDGK